MTLEFEGCPAYMLTCRRAVEKMYYVNNIISIIFHIAPMYGLVVKEANSLLDRPVIYIDG